MLDLNSMIWNFILDDCHYERCPAISLSELFEVTGRSCLSSDCFYRFALLVCLVIPDFVL
jgi:hypothetical protein